MKPQPHNQDAEQSILGAILLRNEAINQLDGLLAEDFYLPANKEIYKAMLWLSEKGKPIDPVTLEDRLLATEALNATGGIVYISELVSGVPTADNIQHYADIVKGKSSIRRMILASSEVAAKGYEADDPGEYLELAERLILQAGENKKSSAGPQGIYQVMKETAKGLDKLTQSGGVTGIPTGFEELDFMLGGLQPSDLTILAARPAVGKTALALNIAANASIELGFPVVIFSLEMSSTQLGQRMMFSEARISVNRLKDRTASKADYISLGTAQNRLATAPIEIDDSSSLGPQELRSRCRRWRSDKKLFNKKDMGLIIVDYLQLMRAKGMNKNSNREQEISEISRGMKGLAKELGCPVLALSQINRGVESREDKRPTLSDLRESGAIEQDSDVVLLLYRDEIYTREKCKVPGVAELDIAKQRHGPTGKVTLHYSGEFTRFDNPSRKMSMEF